MNESTTRIVIKDKKRIIQHVKSAAPMQSTITSKRRGHLIEEMENLLQTWIEDLHQQHIPISLMLIQEKALSPFEDLKRKNPNNVAEPSFNVSHGWFQRFKAQAKLHNIKVTGEAASADEVGPEQFSKILAEFIQNEITFHN